ncbi:MAG TPA: ABC transporter ATP-binding protein [Acetobacteraceae bacterium]|nr:ABC transporter ATP-binding protein [Acetobacteraceae bacterium]
MDNVHVRFGGIIALAGVSFSVAHGEICGLIGPNGSGKTTLFNCISGIYRAGQGEIRFEGEPLGRLKRYKIIGRGIGRTFQNVALFRSMSVRENVLTGAHHLGRTGFAAHALALPSARAEAAAREAELREVLAFLELDGVADVPVSGLPFGTRKRVEFARALISRPKLLLLDEPAAGLNHTEVDGLRVLLGRVRAHYTLSILLVEHHMALVMQVSEKVVALEFGAKIAEGTPEAVRNNPAVIRAYLGDAEPARAA